MTEIHKRPTRLLTACSLASGAAALVCGVVFRLAPKHGIAVVAAFSALGCIVLSVIAIALGIVALLSGKRTKS